MEALLAEALQDFEDDRDQATFPGQGFAAASSSNLVPASASGTKGPSLPQRPAQRVTDETSSSVAAAAPTTAALSATSSRPAPSMPQLPPRTQKSKSAQPNLRPDVQKLAEDIMRLMEESGLDIPGAEPPTEDSAAGQLSDFSSPVLRDLAERALQAVEAEAAAASSSSTAGGSSSSAGLPSVPASDTGFRSAALKGLADHTKQTVEEQSKVARGEGKSTAGDATGPRPPPPGSGGSGLFGDLFGMLNSAGLGESKREGGSMGFMVDFIMQNLLSKEVLYGPLKDIRDKYPPWLEANRATLPPEDLERYTAQLASIQAVCKQYEEDPSNFQRLVDLIQQMQTYGDPPSAIVEEMVPGAPAGLMGASSDPDDIGNFDMPEFEDLPKELKDKCPVQ